MPDTLTAAPPVPASRPGNVEALMCAIAARHDTLPRQLRRIADYVSAQRERIVVDRVGDIARACGVHPSAIVRFSQRLGFSGFSELQQLFRDDYARKTTPAQNYQQRIRRLLHEQAGETDSTALALECIDAARAGLDRLAQALDGAAFELAVGLLAEADDVYVVGVRRSLAAASYLVYNLQHTQKRIHLVSGLGGGFREQIRSIRAGDVLVAVSFSPYGRETEQCARIAQRHGARLVAITDSPLSPLAKRATAALLVNEGSTFAFRSLSATMALCQALFLALGCRLQLTMEAHPPPGEAD